MKINESLNRLIVTLTAVLLLLTLTVSYGAAPVTAKRTPGNFSSIDVSGAFNVTLIAGTSCDVKLEGDAEDLKAITTKVSGSKLEVFVKANHKVNAPVHVVITYVNLKSIECSGAVNLAAAQPVKTDKLEIDLSGSGNAELDLAATALDLDISGTGNVTLRGSVKNTSIEVSGAGMLAARDLQSENCWVDISGTGNVEIKVSNLLEADIAGAGKISYSGDPVVHKSVTGTGKVVKI